MDRERSRDARVEVRLWARSSFMHGSTGETKAHEQQAIGKLEPKLDMTSGVSTHAGCSRACAPLTLCSVCCLL